MNSWQVFVAVRGNLTNLQPPVLNCRITLFFNRNISVLIGTTVLHCTKQPTGFPAIDWNPSTIFKSKSNKDNIWLQFGKDGVEVTVYWKKLFFRSLTKINKDIRHNNDNSDKWFVMKNTKYLQILSNLHSQMCLFACFQSLNATVSQMSSGLFYLDDRQINFHYWGVENVRDASTFSSAFPVVRWQSAGQEFISAF